MGTGAERGLGQSLNLGVTSQILVAGVRCHRAPARRNFIYTDLYKVGNPEAARPPPPTLFSDTYLFKKAKTFVIDVSELALLDAQHGRLMAD